MRNRKGELYKTRVNCKNIECKYNSWRGKCEVPPALIVKLADEPCPMFALNCLDEIMVRSCWVCHAENSRYKDDNYLLFHCNKCGKFFKNGRFQDHVQIKIPKGEDR